MQRDDDDDELREVLRYLTECKEVWMNDKVIIKDDHEVAVAVVMAMAMSMAMGTSIQIKYCCFLLSAFCFLLFAFCFLPFAFWLFCLLLYDLCPLAFLPFLGFAFCFSASEVWETHREQMMVGSHPGL